MTRRRFGDFFGELSGERAIAYYPRLVPVAGSVNAAILLGQLTYWTPRARDPDGWIYKTQAELAQETGLGRWEQETARKLLRSSRILLEKKAGVPARLYFKIDHEALSRAWEETYPEVDESQDEEPPQPRMRKSRKQGVTSANGAPPRMRGSRKQARGETTDKPAAGPQTLKEQEISSSTTSTTTGGGGADEEELAVQLPSLMRSEGIAEEILERAIAEALSALRLAIADDRLGSGPISYCLGVARRVQRNHEAAQRSDAAASKVEQRRLELEAVCPHGSQWATCSACQQEVEAGERLRARINKRSDEAVA